MDSSTMGQNHSIDESHYADVIITLRQTLRDWVATTALQETKPPIQAFVNMDGQIMRNGTGCVLGVSKFSVPGMAMQLDDMIS